MSTDPVKFCYNIGYAGYAKFQEYLMLATDGSFQLTHNQMFTTGVYGGRIDNASAHIASAPDFPTVSANIGFQLTSGSKFFSSLGNSISSLRYKWNNVTVYPNGYAGYKSNMYTQSLQYSTSQDSLVTGSVAFKGADINSVTTDNKAGFSNANHRQGINGKNNTYLSSLTPQYNDVFPYYGTQWTFSSSVSGISSTSSFGSTLSNDIISWSITSSQQINFVKICNCSMQQINQLKADFAVLGFMQVSGSAQLIGINQRFGDGLMFYYIGGTNTLTMKSASGKTRTIKIFNMQCTDISSSLQTGTNLITTSFNFMVFSNKSSTPIIQYLDS